MIGRIFSSRACDSIVILYATSPKDMLVALQHLVYPGRSRWLCGASLQSVNNVWSSAGYGHGQVYHDMSAGVSSFSISKMEHCVSGFDQSRSC